MSVSDAYDKVQPRHIDAVLYVCLGAAPVMQAYFSSDDAYKYVNPYVLFWLKAACVAAGAGAAALKAYRSNGWSKQSAGGSGPVEPQQPPATTPPPPAPVTPKTP